jgi:hypothetical protein
VPQRKRWPNTRACAGEVLPGAVAQARVLAEKVPMVCRSSQKMNALKRIYQSAIDFCEVFKTISVSIPPRPPHKRRGG